MDYTEDKRRANTGCTFIRWWEKKTTIASPKQLKWYIRAMLLWVWFWIFLPRGGQGVIQWPIMLMLKTIIFVCEFHFPSTIWYYRWTDCKELYTRETVLSMWATSNWNIWVIHIPFAHTHTHARAHTHTRTHTSTHSLCFVCNIHEIIKKRQQL